MWKFVETFNTRKFTEICDDLLAPSSLVGPSLAQVTGPAGRGKSSAARFYAINNSAVIYLAPMLTRTPAMVLREICFELSGLRPARTDNCLDVIGDEMSKERKLIIIDESDLLEIRCLELLRNVNESFACPILLIGEDNLKRKIGTRRRLFSRVRHRLEFKPINQIDIVCLFKAALGNKINADVASAIHKHALGDWRPVLNVAVALERTLKTSNLKEITLEMVNNVTKNA
jgi:DNA transposition AAA+ family ATPase